MTVRALGLAIASALAALSSACTPGAYPLDIFPEMHYQRSHRALEPERLAPPDGAVPVTGAPPALTFAQARELTSPLGEATVDLDRARRIYRVNCATCHGATGAGDGPMAPYFAASPAAVVPPTDLASPRVRARTDGELWWLIGNGIGNMPPYRALLSDDEIWLMVRLIRDILSR